MITQPLFGSQYRLPASVEYLDDLFENFSLFMEEVGLSPELQNEWKVVFMEVVSNAITHGSGGDETLQVEVNWSLRGKEIWLEVADSGKGPENLDNIDTSLPDNPLETVGRGLFLIEQFSSRWEHWAGPFGYRQLVIREHPEIHELTTPNQPLLDSTLEELSHSYESLTAFYELGEALILSENVCKFIDKALRNLRDVIDADTIKITPTGGLESELLKELQTLEHFESLTPEDNRLQSKVLLEGEEFVWEKSDEVLDDAALKDYETGILCPIKAGTKTIALLTLGKNTDRSFLKASELNTIRTFSDLLGIAIAQANNVIIRDQAQKAVSELEIAAEVQNKLLPLPKLPTENMGNIFAARTSAREVAGDYIDACINANGDLTLITVDVMGKGVSAALLGAMTRTAFNLNVGIHTDPLDLINAMNQALCQQVGDLTFFATCAIATISKDLSKLHIANAGHCAPLLFENGNTTEVNPSGPPLGLFEDAEYAVETFNLNNSSKLLMVTDGLFEWGYKDGIWGWENFLEFIQNQNLKNPQSIWNNLEKTIQEQSSDTDPSDDQTFLFWNHTNE